MADGATTRGHDEHESCTGIDNRKHNKKNKKCKQAKNIKPNVKIQDVKLVK